MYFLEVGKEIWWPTSSNLFAPWKTAAKVEVSQKAALLHIPTVGYKNWESNRFSLSTLNIYLIKTGISKEASVWQAKPVVSSWKEKQQDK